MSKIENQSGSYGSALGPDWSLDLTMKGKNKEVNIRNSFLESFS